MYLSSFEGAGGDSQHFQYKGGEPGGGLSGEKPGGAGLFPGQPGALRTVSHRGGPAGAHGGLRSGAGKWTAHRDSHRTLRCGGHGGIRGVPKIRLRCGGLEKCLRSGAGGPFGDAYPGSERGFLFWRMAVWPWRERYEGRSGCGPGGHRVVWRPGAGGSRPGGKYSVSVRAGRGSVLRGHAWRSAAVCGPGAAV